METMTFLRERGDTLSHDARRERAAAAAEEMVAMFGDIGPEDIDSDVGDSGDEDDPANRSDLSDTELELAPWRLGGRMNPGDVEMIQKVAQKHAAERAEREERAAEGSAHAGPAPAEEGHVV